MLGLGRKCGHGQLIEEQWARTCGRWPSLGLESLRRAHCAQKCTARSWGVGSEQGEAPACRGDPLAGLDGEAAGPRVKENARWSALSQQGVLCAGRGGCRCTLEPPRCPSDGRRAGLGGKLLSSEGTETGPCPRCSSADLQLWKPDPRPGSGPMALRATWSPRHLRWPCPAPVPRLPSRTPGPWEGLV